MLSYFVLKTPMPEQFMQIMRLLRGAIVLEYKAFNDPTLFNSEQANILALLEDHSRKRLYDQLIAARSDISGLEPIKLLKRDLKIIDHYPNLNIAVPFFPTTIEVSYKFII